MWAETFVECYMRMHWPSVVYEVYNGEELSFPGTPIRPIDLRRTLALYRADRTQAMHDLANAIDAALTPAEDHTWRLHADYVSCSGGRTGSKPAL